MKEDELKKLIFRAHAWMIQLTGDHQPQADLLEDMESVAGEYAREHDLGPIDEK